MLFCGLYVEFFVQTGYLVGKYCVEFLPAAIILRLRPFNCQFLSALAF